MPSKNGEFLKKLLATFRVEADEHVQALSSGLIGLERAPPGEQMKIIETVFREAHSLKGAARAVNLTEIESVCQSLESVFAALKDKTLAISPPLFDLLHQAIDAIGGLLSSDTTAKPAIAALIRRLENVSKEPEAACEESPAAIEEVQKEASPAVSSAPPPEAAAEARSLPALPGLMSETVRISTAKLDAVMRQTEELLAPRLAAGQRARELREACAALGAWKRERAGIRPILRVMERSLERAGKKNGGAKGDRELAKLFEYLDAENRYLETLEERLARLEKSAEQDQRALTGMVDGLLHDVKEMHMLPLSSVLDSFPRFVRELARGQGKEVDLESPGGEIEIDRRILDEMKDPLIHLLRNCIDHGIEKPAARQQKNKPPRGTITVAISQKDSGKIEILIADDGAGIDAGKVRAAACRLGVMSAEEAQRLGEREVLMLVLRSGVSTSPIITDVSGRGLGLAIVQEKVERLGGMITLESRPGAGTTFRIVLPLTLATFRGVLVRAGEHLCIIPEVSVERVILVAAKDIQTVENRETVPLDGQVVSLASLSDALELPRKGAGGESVGNAQAVVLGLGSERIAFRVDEVLGEQEVLVRNLGPQLARVRNIAGAAVLGTGQVVPVLNVPDLMKSAVKRAAAARAPTVSGQPIEAKKRSILVVEDSITSRSLLKNILESVGYQVATAVDGIDAYTALKTDTFDLVVSDVEMPRMDGFDLTAKIRADKNLSELPVVLVTALESREHRERGIDAGANAYIVKSSFDQSNLLEIVRRLI